MLLDDRRIVLALEAICWCAAGLVFLGDTDLPRAIAILPVLLGVLIRIEYPPPGRGVGARAAAAANMSFDDERHCSLLSKQGELLHDHSPEIAPRRLQGWEIVVLVGVTIKNYSYLGRHHRHITKENLLEQKLSLYLQPSERQIQEQTTNYFL